MAKRNRTAGATAQAVADGAYVNMVAQLGTQRDKASGGQFAIPLPLNDLQIDSAYAADWLSRRIIERPAADMLRAGWYYTGATPDQITRIDAEAKRIRLLPTLLQLLALTRLYGTAYVLLGVNDGLATTEPLERARIRAGSLGFLTVLPKKRMTHSTAKLPPEQANGHTNRPVYYTVQPEQNGGGRPFNVHHSRVMRLDQLSLAGTSLHADGTGMSVLQTVHDVVLRYASVNASAASLVHESKVDVIKTKGLVDKLLSDAKSVMERFGAMAMLKSINGMLVMDKDEEDYDSKTYSFTGLPELMREFSIQTAGAAEIPYTILFGQSPAGLNSTGEHDTRNYYDSIATQQDWALRPVLMELLDVLMRSALNTPIAGFDVVFNPLWQLDPKTRAEIEKSNSERDKTYLDAGVITEAQAAQQLVDDGTYTVIDEQHLNDLRAMVGQQDDTTPNA